MVAGKRAVGRFARGQAACVFPSVFFSSRSLAIRGMRWPRARRRARRRRILRSPGCRPSSRTPATRPMWTTSLCPGKPAAILSGTSTWDDGFTNLKNAFRKIEEELTRVGDCPRRAAAHRLPADRRPRLPLRRHDPGPGGARRAADPVPRGPLRHDPGGQGPALRAQGALRRDRRDLRDDHRLSRRQGRHREGRVRRGIRHRPHRAVDASLEVNIFVQPQ